MRETIRKGMSDESGSAAIEYSLLAGLLGAAILPALLQFRARAQSIFDFLAWAIGPSAQ